MSRWTKTKQEHLEYCRERRRLHWKCMMAWSAEVRKWEKRKLEQEDKR